MVADDTIMCHMRQRHEQTIVAYFCLFALAGGAVNGNALANRRAVADNRITAFALKFQILRHLTYRCPLKNVTFLADAGRPFYHRMRSDYGSVPYFNLIVDYRVGSDFHIFADVGFRGNLSRGVYINRRRLDSLIQIYHLPDPLFTDTSFHVNFSFLLLQSHVPCRKSPFVIGDFAGF